MMFDLQLVASISAGLIGLCVSIAFILHINAQSRLRKRVEVRALQSAQIQHVCMCTALSFWRIHIRGAEMDSV